MGTQWVLSPGNHCSSAPFLNTISRRATRCRPELPVGATSGAGFGTVTGKECRLCERLGDALGVAAASKRVLKLLPGSHYPDEVKKSLAASAERRLAGSEPPEHAEPPEPPEANQH